MKNENETIWLAIENLIEEIRTMQEKVLIENARRIIPNLTSDDLLQPNDYPELENNSNFRYEEGIFSGIQTIQMAIRSLKQDLTYD